MTDIEGGKAVNIIAKAKPLTASEVKQHADLITEVLLKVMKPGLHYGEIPGTDKPTLLKPGAEKILTTFRIAAMPEILDMSEDGEIRYQVKVRGVHQPTGTVVGEGVGECSSMEDKYAWRAVICKEEWDATPETKRRVKWSKGYGDKPNYSTQQVRTNPADLANTILKMAKKRGMVDLTLTATAASDVFGQDVDDMPPELRELFTQRQEQSAKVPKKAAAGGNTNKPITEGQINLLKAKLRGKQKLELDFFKRMGVNSFQEITMGKMNDAIAVAEE